MENNILEKEQAETAKQPYIGSVRFFKNIILLLVVVMIAVPTVTTFCYRDKLKRANEKVAITQQQLTDMQSTAVSDNKSDEKPKTEAAASADAPEYQQLYPDFYAPQKYSASKRRENMMFLTFDDGPTRRTDEILDILSQRDIKATFFVVHHDDTGTAERLKRIVDEGHTIAMHSYIHDYAKIYDSVESFLEDMYKIFSEIKEATGHTPTIFRFPGGSINVYNATLYQEMISEMIRRGFVPFDWNMSMEDASNPPLEVSQLVANVTDGASKTKRGVLLMHDSADKFNTVEALPIAIERLKNMGFNFDRLTPTDVPVIYKYKE